MKRAVLSETGKWAGPEAGGLRRLRLCWTGPRQGGVGVGVKSSWSRSQHHELESQTAEQGQKKNMTGTKLGCGIFAIGKTWGRRHKGPECEGPKSLSCLVLSDLRQSATLLVLPCLWDRSHNHRLSQGTSECY